MTIAIYPGSFDPMTLGHLDIVTRASRLFQHVWLAVAENRGKRPFLPMAERVSLIRNSIAHLSNVSVESFSGLTVQYARHHGAKVIVRGLRAFSDFELECAMSQANKKLGPEIETVFLMSALEHQFLSSSMVKEIAGHHGDLNGLVPPAVQAHLTAWIAHHQDTKESQTV